VAAPRRSARTRSSRFARLLGLAVILAIAVAYVHPLGSYRSAQHAVAERKAQAAALAEENANLGRRLSLSGTEGFAVREARKLGLVRPGERLFIVKGVDKAGLR
jgi:hypothetical protein